MLVCLFAPTVFFTLIGYKALGQVGRRPSSSAGVLIALITKLVAAASVLIGLQMLMLRVFAPRGS